MDGGHTETGNGTGETPAGRIAAEAALRCTFAIISHPDAGKTTLTEKLLLYGGAIHLAGSVMGRRAARHATSDWMLIEQQRGISVTSTVLQFDFGGRRCNLLDTPGHEDFSEDTFRTLVAADTAVMLLDNRRGVEERTRQLFGVCRRRRLPIFTVVNKCDRAGADPLQLLTDVERDLGIRCHARTWPVFRDGAFAGVCNRATRTILLFERTGDHGARRVRTTTLPLDTGRPADLLGDPAVRQLREELDLLDGAGHPFSAAALEAGDLTPVYFASALTNFGVEPFLRDFVALAPPPTARISSLGPVDPAAPFFSGFVFKIQANMDPRHRDRVAFIRVCSGHFRAGMEVTLQRTSRRVRLAAPQQFMARERTGVEEAWPGDIVGVIDKGILRIGDTLTDGLAVRYGDLPRFPPERFCRVRPLDPLRRKQFDAGLRQLSEEGAAQVFYTDSEAGPAPIVGAVGPLQFDVMAHRLEHEYGVRCRFDPLGFGSPRWITGPKPAMERASRHTGRLGLVDAHGHPLLVFADDWSLRYALANEPNLTFAGEAP